MHKHRQICEESDKAQLSLKSTNHKLSREVSCLSITQTADSRYYTICTCFFSVHLNGILQASHVS